MIMYKNRKQLSTKMLIIYMVTALLFLTSVELHIHTQETAVAAGHGSAVSISSLAENLIATESKDEISVSPDSALKLKQSNISLWAVFLLIAVMLTVLCRTFIGRLREGHTQLSLIPFYGTPSLRAPPL